MVVIIVAMVVVVFPTCRTGQCTMASDRMPSPMSQMSSPMGLAYKMACDGTAMVSRALDGALPVGTTTLFVALVAVLALAILPLAPRFGLHRLMLPAGEPPGPPLDPCGVRLLI